MTDLDETDAPTSHARPTRSQRAVRTFLDHRPTGWSALVPAIALVAGLLFSVSGTTARGTNLRSDTTDLPGLIRERTHDNAVRGAEAEQLRATVDSLEQEEAPGNAALRRARTKADTLAPTAGLQAVTGPSVTVSLDDAPLTAEQIPDGFSVDDVVVHQQDVQGVVNALWRAGAEAMMIQDQRVISTSAVRCVGNTLILQGRVYSPPFVITAIGDPTKLQESLDKDKSVKVYREYVDALGLGYEVSVSDSSTLPAYQGQTTLSHARAR